MKAVNMIIVPSLYSINEHEFRIVKPFACCQLRSFTFIVLLFFCLKMSSPGFGHGKLMALNNRVKYCNPQSPIILQQVTLK